MWRIDSIIVVENYCIKLRKYYIVCINYSVYIYIYIYIRCVVFIVNIVLVGFIRVTFLVEGLCNLDIFNLLYSLDSRIVGEITALAVIQFLHHSLRSCSFIIKSD